MYADVVLLRSDTGAGAANAKFAALASNVSVTARLVLLNMRSTSISILEPHDGS
ncbi:hypothetical protein AND4_03439 [Vibrio sp. AND4]|nr:hypothetical protein AND4_03439 [Vibrio sp. AND4]